MHPILVSALTNVAVDLYKRFTAAGPSDAGAVEEKKEAPKTWQQAHADITAYVEEQNKVNKEQSGLIVKIAEKADAFAEAQRALSERLERHIVSARRIQIVSLLGGLCGAIALVLVVLK